MGKKVSEKKGSKFKNFLILIIFLILGVFLGYFGTTKYLDYVNSNKDDDINEVISESDEPVDITNNTDYQSTIKRLYGIVDGNPEFLNSMGINISSLDSSFKLRLVYNNMNQDQYITKEELTPVIEGTELCDYSFIVDSNEGQESSSSVCTVEKIEFSKMLEVYTSLFNDNNLEKANDFLLTDSKKCVLDSEQYICGNVTPVSGETGELEEKFDITLVTKEKDGTINIFDKGYLQDTRSSTSDLNLGYENYYLHSFDSKDYYNELKSADNLTFKHIFKLDKNNNYYYAETVVNK